MNTVDIKNKIVKVLVVVWRVIVIIWKVVMVLETTLSLIALIMYFSSLFVK